MTEQFARTEKAATADKRSRWDLVAAIAEDAVDAGLSITSLDSQLAARSALTAAGLELANGTVANMTVVSKFDHESTPAQRKVWRRYGAATVDLLVRSGWSQTAVAEFLDVPERRTAAECKAESKRVARQDVLPEPDLSEAWTAWLNKINAVLTDGAELAERSDGIEGTLTGHAAMALTIYGRISERKLDAEIRDLLESSEVK